MDDPKDFNIEEDSTYLIIKEAVSRGVKCFYNDPKWIYVDLNNKKKWLLDVAQKVERQAKDYSNQIKKCKFHKKSVF